MAAKADTLLGGQRKTLFSVRREGWNRAGRGIEIMRC